MASSRTSAEAKDLPTNGCGEPLLRRCDDRSANRSDTVSLALSLVTVVTSSLTVHGNMQEV